MKMETRLCVALLLGFSLTACSEPLSPLRPVASDAQTQFAKTGVSDPTTTFKLPLAVAGLSLKSDGEFSDGTYSAYAHGVCGVKATIFAGGSGDAVMEAGIRSYADRKCTSYPRKVIVLYPDGVSETIPGQAMALRQLQSQTYRIAIGSTAKRHFHVRTATARCEGVHWGAPVGGDSVLVTRTAANTWHVYTQPYPNDQAACKSSSGNTLLGHMPVDLWIVSSTDLP
jgi:hypothetical protein